MSKKKYNQNTQNPVVGEPGLAYRTTAIGMVNTNRSGSMSVDEYFDKVKKALDKRW